MQITANEMYPENSVFVDKLLNDMATMPIVIVGMEKASIFCLLYVFLMNFLESEKTE